ncbi:MAG: exodeoxyribonuclease VII large subunit [Thermodesulfobacteriota bacterium]
MTREDLFSREILTVSELTGRLAGLIEEHFGLVWLTGEISNLRRPASGHLYLTLKDEAAQIRAVMFRTQQRYLAFEPEDGQEVLARGRLSVYQPRGEYQIVLDWMEPRGEGALRLAFEKLKARLAGEGLFDQARKKRLPFLPGRVAVVTSPTGAAVRDFVRVARRRFENVHLSIYPVRVQGEGAAEEIAAAVRELNRAGGFDLIVLARGGGSLEDLWAFNEEVVARAVAASEIPVVSAVGHEVDFTIADFAADLRAPTPSAAAEMIFREKAELETHLARTSRRLLAGLKSRLDLGRARLAHLATRLGDPSRKLTEQRLRVDDLTERLVNGTRRVLVERRLTLAAARARLAPAHPRLRLEALRSRLEALVRALVRAGRGPAAKARERLAALAGRLNGLSPLAVLERGYALARVGPDRKTLRSSAQVKKGDHIDLVLAGGELDVAVDEVIR